MNIIHIIANNKHNNRSKQKTNKKEQEILREISQLHKMNNTDNNDLNICYNKSLTYFQQILICFAHNVQL